MCPVMAVMTDDRTFLGNCNEHRTTDRAWKLTRHMTATVTTSSKTRVIM